MQVRVADSLAKLISPIASSVPHGTDRQEQGKGQWDNPRDKEKQRDKEIQRSVPSSSKPSLTLIKNPANELSQEPAPEDEKKESLAPHSSPVDLSETESFLKIFSVSQLEQNELQTQLGRKNYQVSIRKQKKSATFKKGSILDKTTD